MAPITLSACVAVALGGALGAVLRFVMSTSVNQALPGPFPSGTLAVNLVGSLLFGLIAALASKTLWISEFTRLLLLTGVFGALTTFSTFSSETLQLLQAGKLLIAGVSILANVSLCLFAVWLGIQIVDRL